MKRQSPDETMTLSHRTPNSTRTQPGNGADGAASDEECIKRFLDGDENAFIDLVRRHQEKVRNLIFSILGYTQIVDDLSQDVFIKVYQALPQFRFQSAFSTWLYRVTVNRCRDEMRRNKVRRILRLDALEEDDHPADLEATEKTERVLVNDALNKALNSLTDTHRTMIILKEVEGLSYEEIAEAMNCGVGTVKSRLARARTRLKKVLQPFVEE